MKGLGTKALVGVLLGIVLCVCGAQKPAQAALQPGYVQIDANWGVLSLTSSQAHEMADRMLRFRYTREGLGIVLGSLAPLTPAPYAYGVAVALALSASYFAPWQIHWCADRAPFVYITIYHGSIYAGASRAW